MAGLTNLSGPGTYPTIADAAVGAEAALRATAERAVATASDPATGAVEVVAGDALDMLGVVTAADLVSVEVDGTRADDATTGPTRREKHTVSLTLTVLVFRMTDDLSETVQRAWDVLALIDDRIRTVEPDLTDPADPSKHPTLWCRLRSTEQASANQKVADGYMGRITAIRATCEAAVIAQSAI